MPVLKCARREKFAQGVASGLSQAEAYRQAFPTSQKWKNETVWVKASHLMADGTVSTRVDELKSEAAEQVGLTVQDLIDELEEARTIAMTAQTPQSSAAVAATLGKAKLLGMDKQLVELTGKDGGPIQTMSVNLNVDALTVVELRTLKALLEKAGIADTA